MRLSPDLPAGERLGALLLMLVLLAVLTGVSLSQAGLLDDQADTLQDQTLPAMRRLQELRHLVDEARGLEALHVLTDDPTERQRIAGRLQRQREAVQGRLAAQAARASANQDQAADTELEAEQRLLAQLQQRLAAYWAAQDQVLAAPHPGEEAAGHGAAAPRALLAGQSQTAWQALGQALDQWQQAQAQRAAAIAQQSRSQAQWLRLMAAGVLGAVLVVSALLAHRFSRRPPPSGAPHGAGPGADAGLPQVLESLAERSRLLALNAAVQAARQGQPSAADLAERAHLAAEAEALARRCDAARRALHPAPARPSALREPDPA